MGYQALVLMLVVSYIICLELIYLILFMIQMSFRSTNSFLADNTAVFGAYS